MFSAVLDRLFSVFRPAAARQAAPPRLAAIALLAGLSWGLLALVVLAAVWVFRLAAGV
jgi:hypothetical protein